MAKWTILVESILLPAMLYGWSLLLVKPISHTHDLHMEYNVEFITSNDLRMREYSFMNFILHIWTNLMAYKKQQQQQYDDEDKKEKTRSVHVC